MFFCDTANIPYYIWLNKADQVVDLLLHFIASDVHRKIVTEVLKEVVCGDQIVVGEFVELLISNPPILEEVAYLKESEKLKTIERITKH